MINGDVVTIIRLQNRATGAIAGLKVDEFWWDESGNPLPGDSQRIRQPLMPGEVATIELRVPRDSRMNRNNYSFSHANGEIKATLVTELPDPEEEEEAGDEGEPTELHSKLAAPSCVRLTDARQARTAPRPSRRGRATP